MDTKSDEQFIIIEATIEHKNKETKYNKQEYDEKMMKLKEDFIAMLASTIKSIMYQITMSKSSPAHKDSPKPQDLSTRVPDNSRDPPLDIEYSKNNGCMYNIKHKISLPKFYELLIKTEHKGDTDMDIQNNHIKMCLNTVTRLWNELLPAYKPIKRLSEFEE